MQKDWSEAQGDISKKWGLLKNQFESFTAPHLEKILNDLKAVVDYMEAHPRVMKAILTGGAVAGGTMIASKTVGVGKDLYGFGKDIYGLFRGKSKGGGLGTTIGAMMNGATPVYVVNMGSMNSTLGSLENGVKKVSSWGKVAVAGTTALAIGTAGAIGAKIGNFERQYNNVWLAALTGGKYHGEGAWGEYIGDKIDYKGGGKIGNALYDILNKISPLFQSHNNLEKPQNNINVHVHIDPKGRTVSESDSPNTRVNGINHGNFFPGVGEQ